MLILAVTAGCLGGGSDETSMGTSAPDETPTPSNTATPIRTVSTDSTPVRDVEDLPSGLSPDELSNRTIVLSRHYNILQNKSYSYERVVQKRVTYENGTSKWVTVLRLQYKGNPETERARISSTFPRENFSGTGYIDGKEISERVNEGGNISYASKQRRSYFQELHSGDIIRMQYILMVATEGMSDRFSLIRVSERDNHTTYTYRWINGGKYFVVRDDGLITGAYLRTEEDERTFFRLRLQDVSIDLPEWFGRTEAES